MIRAYFRAIAGCDMSPKADRVHLSGDSDNRPKIRLRRARLNRAQLGVGGSFSKLR
jgi:hypothetical protein